MTRVAGICGLLAFVTMNIGWIAGGFAQPSAYSFANDDISDLGSLRANDAWVYNQLGANLTGVLIVVFAIGLWIALSPSILGRIGAGVLAVGGVGSFLDGFFRLDCRGSTQPAQTTPGIRRRTRSSPGSQQQRCSRRQ